MNPRKTITAITLAAVVLVATAGAAAACHPDLEVHTDCEQVTATATPWADGTPDQRVNADVVVLLDGAPVATGALSPATPLTATVPATPGRHTVTVTARAPWGPNGEHGDAGSTTSAVVDVEACPPIDHTIEPPEWKSTIVDVQVVEADIVAELPAVVAGETVERPTVLAFTGSTTTPLALAGAALLMTGIGVLIGVGLAAKSDDHPAR